eukprot:868760-Amphidinium_carterae.1
MAFGELNTMWLFFAMAASRALPGQLTEEGVAENLCLFLTLQTQCGLWQKLTCRTCGLLGAGVSSS